MTRIKIAMLMISAGLSAALLSGCAGATAEQQAAAASARKLTGQEIMQTMSGNSLTGRSETGKSQWTQFYDPSGQIVGIWKSSGGSGKYAATWKVEGDTLCEDHEESKYDGCNAVGVNGNTLYSYDEQGKVRHPERPGTIIMGRAPGI